MSEELKQDVVPEQGNPEPQPERPEVEVKALEMGWRPKEEFDGDESEFIDAQEFVRRKPLFDKIDTVGRELRETRKALKALQTHHSKVREVEYQRAMEELREQKKEALREGDEDKLVMIDEQIADAKASEKMAQFEAKQQASQPHPGFVQWVERNKWYAQDGELRSAADQIGVAYAAANPDLHPDEVLKYLEGRIKKLYPEKFQNPNKSRPSVVEGGSKVSGGTKKEDSFDLTEEERKAMNTFVRQNIMTKEEYIAEIKKVRG